MNNKMSEGDAIGVIRRNSSCIRHNDTHDVYVVDTTKATGEEARFGLIMRAFDALGSGVIESHGNTAVLDAGCNKAFEKARIDPSIFDKQVAHNC